MRAVRIHEYGRPDVLHTEEVPIPEPGPGQVLIAVEAISVGFAQTQMRRNIFPAPMWRPEFPITLGGDVIGEVVALGPGTAGVATGDRVGAFTLHGAYAEYVVVDAATLLPVPAELDAAQATALPAPGPIAMGTMGTAALAQGESVLVHAGAGGIGHLAVQLARSAGAGQVIATAGTAEKCAYVRSLGADVVVDYSRPDWSRTVREATDGRGVDVILDGVGGEVLRQGVGLLAPLGRLVFYGSAGGGTTIPSVSPMDLIGLKFVTGFALSAWRTARPERYRADHESLTARLLAGTVRHTVHMTLPLEDVAKAHEIVESRAHIGRLVLLTGRASRAAGEENA